MTLHITTITPNHVITVSDRLIATSKGYRELDNDKYEHLVLITDDAKVVITFAGFAGIPNKGNATKTTIDWLTEIVNKASTKKIHNLRFFLQEIRKESNNYINKIRKKGVQSRNLRLAIFTIGWIDTLEYGNIQYGCIIENCLGNWHTWTDDARPNFTMREKHYGNEKFKDGSCIIFLCNERLALKQRPLLKLLNIYAQKNEPKRIFQTSVKIIRETSKKSNGSIGTNCSGIRITKNDPGIESYDERSNVYYDTVMPNIIKSTSSISVSIADFVGKKNN